MADIKPEIAVGKSVPLGEKPSIESENSKQESENIIERKRINDFEQTRKNVISEIDQMENPAPAPAIISTASIIAPMAKRQKQVENILAKDLAEIYLSLDQQKRREFKTKGEETADKINKLLSKTKIDIGGIIKLIKKWLSLIPGMNKYFLEKEAKIKVDELVKLK